MDTTSSIMSSQSLLDKLKEPSFSKKMGTITLIVLIVLSIITIILVSNYGTMPDPKIRINQEVAKTMTIETLISIFFLMLLFGTLFLMLPALSDIKNFVLQNTTTFGVVIYTLLFILFFRSTQRPTAFSQLFNQNPQFFVPLTILITGFIFYKTLQKDDNSKNYIYERIKNIVLLFCFIAIMIVYYNVDPGNYIQKNFGYSLVLTIVLSVFVFLYFIINFLNPQLVSNSSMLSSFKMNNFSFYGGIIFLIYFTIMMLLIFLLPGLKKDENAYTLILTSFILISLVWIIALALSIYTDSTNIVQQINTSAFDLTKKSMLYLFGFIISGLIIGWLVYNLQHVSGKSGISSFILNLLLVLIVLMLVYRTISVRLPDNEANSKKNAIFNLITQLLLYIPCIFSNGLDLLIGFGKKIKEEDTTKTDYMLLITSIILFTSMYIYPMIEKGIGIQGGNQLINEPINLDNLTPLESYEKLNDTIEPDYQYGLSAWFYIDSAPPNTNPSYNTYTSILNYGNKPNILYNAEKNSLRIVVDQMSLKGETKNRMIDFDENDFRIIYEDNNVLLQKWNNIIINYNGGTLDIFINNKLVKSVVGVIPYFNNDMLEVGSKNGISGGICNVIYFKQPLTINDIYYMYKLVKDRNPPIVNINLKTLIMNGNK
jgi:hypothetical protein